MTNSLGYLESGFSFAPEAKPYGPAMKGVCNTVQTSQKKSPYSTYYTGKTTWNRYEPRRMHAMGRVSLRCEKYHNYMIKCGCPSAVLADKSNLNTWKSWWKYSELNLKLGELQVNFKSLCFAAEKTQLISLREFTSHWAEFITGLT